MSATVEIPACSGALVTLEAGHRMRIVDVEGTQVADLFAVSARVPDEWLSASVTRGYNGRLFPAVGHLPAPTKPGDSVTLRADCDVHVIVTACSMDVEPINGLRCTPLRLEVFR